MPVRAPAEASDNATPRVAKRGNMSAMPHAPATNTPAMTTDRSALPLPPGFIALHGNRIETLLDTVAGWLAQHPLAPLESEVILVQSNGMAEWVKMALARNAGVCAAAAVQLPARLILATLLL